MIHTFTVPLEPQGKGRPRFSRRGNKVCTYTPDKTAHYEKIVRQCYQTSGGNVIEFAPLKIEIDAYFSIPKSYSKKRINDIFEKRELPTKKPDCDNIIKIILDALNETAYSDDKQVVEVVCRKHYASPGENGCVRVTICTV